jgi:DNA polymerase IV
VCRPANRRPKLPSLVFGVQCDGEGSESSIASIAFSVKDQSSPSLSKVDRLIAHADMDAFYASVEQLDNPELRGKPVIVGGSSMRGVVTSASYEARKFGVRSAMPSVQARHLCPQGIFVRGRMRRYVEISRLVREVFESFSPVVEPLSLDEAFIDLTGTHRLFGTALEAGQALKRRVLERTGLVVSVGIAPTKMAAKILSDLSKPDGLLVLTGDCLRAFLEPLPVEWLWGVGGVTLQRMNRMGIASIGDLARHDVTALRHLFGSFGPHLHELANGHDPRAVVADWRRKSYGEESTFEHDLDLRSLELRRVLIAHGEAVGRRLRADGVLARTVTLKLKLARPLGGGRYPLITRSTTLEKPTDDGGAIARTATNLLERLRVLENVRLAGIQVHQLERENELQLRLFDSARGLQSRVGRLNRALDEVVRRFGENAITRGLVHAERAAPTRRIK